MKKIFIIILIAFASCKKEANNSIDNLFTETKENIQLNEPLLLSFGDNTSNQIVAWTVEPKANATLEQLGDYATVKFAAAGDYVVKALSNNKQGTYNIKVNNTFFNEFGTGLALYSKKFINVNINEQLMFDAVNSIGSSSTVDWKLISPASFPTYLNNNKTFGFSFSDFGEKHFYFNNTTKRIYRTIWVNEKPTNEKQLKPFIFSDKLLITPSAVYENGVIKQIDFSTSTSFNYMCSNDEIISATYVNRLPQSEKDYVLSFGGVKVSPSICNNRNKATIINNFTDLRIGGNKFFINYENKSFEGTIDIQNNKVTIDFTNNNLIEFTKKIF